MKTVMIRLKAGVFAENKDIAAVIREKILLPELRKGNEILLDFEGIEGATQSFIHAMVSQSIREFGPESLDHIIFKNCNQTVREIVSIVTDYMQESE